MNARLLLLSCALAGCHTLADARRGDDFAVATRPTEEATFRLYRWLQPVGVEVDTYLPLADGGFEAKAIFTLTDRGAAVPMAAAFRLDRDGWPRRLDAWGFFGIDLPLDEHLLALGDGRFVVRRLDQPARTVAAAPPLAAAFGYAPMLGQELLVRAWSGHGRPAKLTLVPGGEARIGSLGREAYTLDGRPRSFEHLVIDGLVWGREDLWLDERDQLAAVVTRDATGNHFEGARRAYVGLVDELVARAGAGAVRWLAGAVRPEPDDGRPVALVGAQLIDGSGAPAVPDAVVVYQGDRILAAGPRATTPVPATARRLDGRGKSVLPGLWDMHAHVEQAEQAAVYLAAGITSARDVGNIMGFITAVRDAIESGQGVGPRLIVDGLVDGSGPLALGTLTLEREADIAPLVERLVRAGCAEVKIYTMLKPELVPPLVAEAHRRGLRVTGHVPFGMTAESAVDVGFDGLNHADIVESLVLPWTLDGLRALSPEERLRRLQGFDVASPLAQRLFAKMAARHVAFDPTLAALELGLYPRAELERREPGLAKLPALLRATIAGADPADAAAGDLTFRKWMEVVAAAHRRGVPIVAGTDQAVLGHSLHRELELYVSCGMTPMEALQAATSLPARLLGRDRELGTIAVGKRADLVVVDGNPLADIRDTRKVWLVVARGRAYRPAPLWQLAGFRP